MAATHKGTSFVEIYQNCNVFNDKVFEPFSDKKVKKSTTIYLQEGKPLQYGDSGQKSIALIGTTPSVVPTDTITPQNQWIHDPSDITKAFMLTQFFDSPHQIEDDDTYLPRPMGVLYKNTRPTYEDLLDRKRQTLPPPESLQRLLNGEQTWVV